MNIEGNYDNSVYNYTAENSENAEENVSAKAVQVEEGIFDSKDLIYKINPDYPSIFQNNEAIQFNINENKMAELDRQAENSTNTETIDGKTYTYITDDYGNVVGTKVSYEDGDTTVEEYDYDGDGVADASKKTTKNENGEKSTDYDWDNDGKTDSNKKERKLDNGKTLVETDYDNDGKVDNRRVTNQFPSIIGRIINPGGIKIPLIKGDNGDPGFTPNFPKGNINVPQFPEDDIDPGFIQI